MPEPRYLLRFDDICPTMNWAMWEAIEKLLVLHGVKPILAVVPDNRDPNLMPDAPVGDFWDRVRRWQAKGYAIALHGHQHVYVNKNPGMMKLNRQSEFAGLPYGEQRTKIQKGLEIFAENGVTAEAWVAPSHSFDRTTLKVLAELGLPVVSDGLWPWPHLEEDSIFWVPQQLWAFYPKPAGIWTVCQHHNSWTEERLGAFARDLAQYASRMTDLSEVIRVHSGRTLTFSDRLTAGMDSLWNHHIRTFAWKVRRSLQRRSAS
jgi:peptidoglycan/xylan/chitin deacetylase (PgdA/CDA1 family)